MELDEIVERFYKEEQVRTAKLYSKVISLRNKKSEYDFILAYRYARNLDDMVDSGENPEKSRDILREQRKTIEDALRKIPIKNTNTSSLILNHLRAIYGDNILEIYRDMISGFEIDNEIILDGKSLNEERLNE